MSQHPVSGTDVSTLHAALDATAAVWTVLSTAYGRLPEKGFVTALRSADQLATWPYADVQSAAGVALLLRSAERGETHEQILTDHRRLFVGPRPLLAAPWESVHRSREGLVFDVQTLEVRAAYREFGLQSPLLNKEPDDHVALEATFVATLCLRALGVLEAGGPGQERYLEGLERFHDEHLARWVPLLLTRVEGHADTDYHLGIAALTAGALTQLAALAAVRPRSAARR